MAENSFTVEVRKETGKGANRRLRSSKNGIDHNPGIVYGIGTPTMVSMRRDHATKFIKQHLASDTKLIDLKITGGEKAITKQVLLQDYQLAPASGKLLHVDFREVTKDLTVVIEVPITTIGVSKAEKSGGVLQIIRHTISLKGKVAKIPAKIDIDVSELDFGSNIHVEDLKLPQGVAPAVPKGENFAIITVSTVAEEQEEEIVATEVGAEEEAAAPDAQAETTPPKE